MGTLLPWVRQRLANRPDSEHLQTMVRISITAMFCVYLGGVVGIDRSNDRLFFTWLILFGELLART